MADSQPSNYSHNSIDTKVQILTTLIHRLAFTGCYYRLSDYLKKNRSAEKTFYKSVFSKHFREERQSGKQDSTESDSLSSKSVQDLLQKFYWITGDLKSAENFMKSKNMDMQTGVIVQCDFSNVKCDDSDLINQYPIEDWIDSDSDVGSLDNPQKTRQVQSMICRGYSTNSQSGSDIEEYKKLWEFNYLAYEPGFTESDSESQAVSNDPKSESDHTITPLCRILLSLIYQEQCLVTVPSSKTSDSSTVSSHNTNALYTFVVPDMLKECSTDNLDISKIKTFNVADFLSTIIHDSNMIKDCSEVWKSLESSRFCSESDSDGNCTFIANVISTNWGGGLGCSTQQNIKSVDDIKQGLEQGRIKREKRKELLIRRQQQEKKLEEERQKMIAEEEEKKLEEERQKVIEEEEKNQTEVQNQSSEAQENTNAEKEVEQEVNMTADGEETTDQSQNQNDIKETVDEAPVAEASEVENQKQEADPDNTAKVEDSEIQESEPAAADPACPPESETEKIQEKDEVNESEQRNDISLVNMDGNHNNSCPSPDSNTVSITSQNQNQDIVTAKADVNTVPDQISNAVAVAEPSESKDSQSQLSDSQNQSDENGSGGNGETVERDDKVSAPRSPLDDVEAKQEGMDSFFRMLQEEGSDSGNNNLDLDESSGSNMEQNENNNLNDNIGSTGFDGNLKYDADKLPSSLNHVKASASARLATGNLNHDSMSNKSSFVQRHFYHLVFLLLMSIGLAICTYIAYDRAWKQQRSLEKMYDQTATGTTDANHVDLKDSHGEL